MSERLPDSQIRKTVSILLLLASFVSVFFAGVHIYGRVGNTRADVPTLLSSVWSGLGIGGVSELEAELEQAGLSDTAARAAVNLLRRSRITLPGLIVLLRTAKAAFGQLLENGAVFGMEAASTQTIGTVLFYMALVVVLLALLFLVLLAALAHAVCMHLMGKPYSGFVYAIAAFLNLLLLFVLTQLGNRLVETFTADPFIHAILGDALEDPRLFHLSPAPVLCFLFSALSCASWILIPVKPSGSLTAGPAVRRPVSVPAGFGIFCSSCGAPVLPDDMFCRNCGSALSDRVHSAPQAPGSFCSNCGAPVQPIDAFCKNCGCALKPGVPPALPAPPTFLKPPAPLAADPVSVRSGSSAGGCSPPSGEL